MSPRSLRACWAFLRALGRQLVQASTFGALWEWVLQEQGNSKQWAQRWPAVPLSQALAELRMLLREQEAAGRR